LSLGPSARSYADCHRDARLWFPSQAKLRRDEDVRTEGDAGANAARRRGFLRREWCERRRSRSGPDQRLLSHIASAGCQIRHDAPPAVVADEIERDVAGDDEARRFELAAQIRTLGPDCQSRRGEPADTAANCGEVVPGLVDEAAPTDDSFDDGRRSVLREQPFRHEEQHGDDGQECQDTTAHLTPRVRAGYKRNAAKR